MGTSYHIPFFSYKPSWDTTCDICLKCIAHKSVYLLTYLLTIMDTRWQLWSAMTNELNVPQLLVSIALLAAIVPFQWRHHESELLLFNCSTFQYTLLCDDNIITEFTGGRTTVPL